MKNYTVFTSKQLSSKLLKKYRAKYPTCMYKRGDVTFVVVCHGKGVVL